LAKRKRTATCDSLMEDTLEAYLLGRLPGQQMGRDDDPEVQAVEEHLLWCAVCQAKAETEEKEIKALRAALLLGAITTERKPAKAKAMAIGLPDSR
jgi:hypothetical protein